MSQRPYTPETIPDSSVDLRSYLTVLRQKRRLIAVVTILCIAAAAAYTFLATPLYTAKAVVQLKPVNIDPDTIGSIGYEKLIQPDTEQSIALSLAVADEARDLLGTNLTSQELLKKVKVTVAPESAIMDIVYTDPKPQEAARGAEAWAEAYLTYRTAQADEQKESDLEIPAKERAELQKEILKLDTPEEAAERGFLQAQYDAINTKYIEISARNTDAGVLLGNPLPPQNPSSPKRALNLALGLFVGLFLGIGLAFFRTRTDDRVRERGDLESAMRAPVLAIIPKDTAWTDATRPRIVTLEDPRSPVAEAYRTLRPSLLVAAAERDVKTIMVVSPAPGEGKSTTTANLGVVLAQADKRVVIVSADLRKARLHDFFGVKNERGLSEVLSGKVPPWESLRRTPIDNLWVLPSGPVPTNPAELLQSQAMRELLSEQRGVVDFILIDCPPVLAVADSLGLAQMSDGVLFVADAGSTTIDAAEQARGALDRVGANVIGSVLNDLDLTTSSSYYGYGYGEVPEAGVPTTNGKAKEVARRKNRAR